MEYYKLSKDKLKDLLHSACGNTKDFVMNENRFIREWCENQTEEYQKLHYFDGIVPNNAPPKVESKQQPTQIQQLINFGFSIDEAVSVFELSKHRGESIRNIIENVFFVMMDFNKKQKRDD